MNKACWDATVEEDSTWSDLTDDEQDKFDVFSKDVRDGIVNGFIDSRRDSITLEFDTDQKQIRVVPLKELA